jgi:hypothetical protein
VATFPKENKRLRSFPPLRNSTPQGQSRQWFRRKLFGKDLIKEKQEKPPFAGNPLSVPAFAQPGTLYDALPVGKFLKIYICKVGLWQDISCDSKYQANFPQP